MKIFVVLCLSAWLLGTARAEDKPKDPVAPAAPALAAAPVAPVADHKATDVIARIGKTEIKWEQLDPAVNTFIKQFSARGRSFPMEQLGRLRYDVLDEMVTRELVLQQTVGHEPTNLAAQVQELIETSKAQAGSPEAYAKAVADLGVTPEEYAKRVREMILIQETIKQAVEPKIKVAAEDCKKFYDDNRSRYFVIPEQVRASHILILCKPEETAEVHTQKMAQIQAALALVKGGTNFADVARKFSEDPGSKEQGGDLGFFARGRMMPEFETAAFALATNQVSAVITTPYGYHIIKATERKASSEVAYANVKDKIEAELKKMQTQQLAQQYFKGLRDKVKVEILLPEPPPMAMPGGMPMPAK